MRKSRFTEEQITLALRQAEAGTPHTDNCRKLEISDTTFFRWKKQYGSLGVSELRELRQLREENRKLKGLVADLTLDKQILQESLRKNGEPGQGPSARCGARGPAGWRRLTACRCVGPVGRRAWRPRACTTTTGDRHRRPSARACTSWRACG